MLAECRHGKVERKAKPFVHPCCVTTQNDSPEDDTALHGSCVCDHARQQACADTISARFRHGRQGCHCCHATWKVDASGGTNGVAFEPRQVKGMPACRQATLRKQEHDEWVHYIHEALALALAAGLHRQARKIWAEYGEALFLAEHDA